MEDDNLYSAGNGCTQKNCKAGKAKMTILLYRSKWCTSLGIYGSL